ncbi:MAG: isocitrate/isopropylmalate family dehydrogenase [Planctomycetota bacterium]|jgi:isocitrate dehydrogenase (NAD+)
MSAIAITELLGDGIGPELRDAVHTVAAVLPIDLDFRPVDLSLENRRISGMAVYDEAVESMRATRISLKYPTVTENESPNAVLRRRLEFSVIHRPVRSIEGIDSNFKHDVHVEIVRVATGGTYDDPGKMIGRDSAVSLRIVERQPVFNAAHFAFHLARKRGFTVTSTSKHTIQRVTDGFFESITRDVHRDYKDVRHKVELFDALLAKLILHPQDFQVVLCLNEYGDFLSDMACGLVGSLGTGASANYTFDENGHVTVAMFDPAGGTAPDIAGEDKANPTAVLLAFGMMLDHIDRRDLGRPVRQSIFRLIKEGECTADLRGSLSCSAFAKAVAKRVTEMLAHPERDTDQG